MLLHSPPEQHFQLRGGDQSMYPSEKRAAAVNAFLVEKGIDAVRLDSMGLGATAPKVSSDTPEGRRTNRRVELVKM